MITPTIIYLRARSRATPAAVAAGLLLLLGTACVDGDAGRTDYEDGDSGAAAPAARITLDSSVTPDSTSGMSNRTGRPGMAGDTLGAKGRATGSPTPAPRTP